MIDKKSKKIQKKPLNKTNKNGAKSEKPQNGNIKKNQKIEKKSNTDQQQNNEDKPISKKKKTFKQNQQKLKKLYKNKQKAKQNQEENDEEQIQEKEQQEDIQQEDDEDYEQQEQGEESFEKNENQVEEQQEQVEEEDFQEFNGEEIENLGEIEAQKNQQAEVQDQQQSGQDRKLITKNLETKLHIGPIYTGGKICLSEDQQYLYSACNFNVSKYDIEKKEIVDTIEHKDEEIANFAIHPTGKYIATFTKNFLIRLLNIETKELVHSWKVNDYFALDMLFDPSGKYLAIGCVNGTIKIFDCKKGSESHSYRNHRGSVTKLAFHPQKDKYLLASVGDDFQIKLYDLIISQQIVSLNAHKSLISTIIFSENGTNLISGGEKIIIWDLVNMKQQATIQYDEDIEALSYFSLKQKQGHRTVEKNYLMVAGLSGEFKAIDISSDDVEITSFSHLKTHEILKIMQKTHKQMLQAEIGGPLFGTIYKTYSKSQKIRNQFFWQGIDEGQSYE
ncbi:WD40-repeat-containing domain [Pseudocohnilembus persalinus]|uniref:WD40-repeat-containing domain n=1 Tax=Pseudocohnilembus persalinus TaxID=266149 RepID=A0A0V0QGR5_PSEPJ|nr:WD40-repeat-containing domain [Pseudocohnilembus persalinus]|eukprot:KRX01398.1 WD40-repeat-containing domain [Pseudocohnilembus persalinus]